MGRKILLILLITTLNNLMSENIELWSESAILIDYDTEQILYQKNIDKIVAPASMTKLVTLYMVYLALENGTTSKDSIVEVSQNADWRNLPRDSSLMFIEQGQHVTLFELMIGLAIPSGNDAAIAIAEHLYGSVNNYLINVNEEMMNLGLNKLKFVDSSGFNDDNEITVSQFVEFCLIFIKKYPKSLEELFSIKSFTYPKPLSGTTSIGGITQYNHNPLIGIYPECDGLKTGFINKSGLNISLTAKNNTRRVIAVLSGVRDDKKSIAETKRVYDSISLLDYGLNEYKNIFLDKIELPMVKVGNANVNSFRPIIPFKRDFTISSEVTFEYDFYDLQAPIGYGEYLGNVILKQSNIKYIFPVYSDKEIYIKQQYKTFIIK